MNDGQVMFQLGMVIFLSVAIFAVMTALCWKYNVAAFKGLVAWFRSLPAWWRMLRDPGFRREQECIATHQAIIMTLYACRGYKNQLQEQIVSMSDGDARLYSTTREYNRTLEDFEALRGYAAKHIANLKDEDIAIIASWFSRESTDGLVTPDEVAAFLKEERKLLRSHPVMVVDHLERQIRFIQPLYDARKPGKPSEPQE
jgi:hypothetical protein